MGEFKIKDKSGNGVISISDPKILGKGFLTIEIEAQYMDEEKPRLVSQYINKRQARRLARRLQTFINQ